MICIILILTCVGIEILIMLGTVLQGIAAVGLKLRDKFMKRKGINRTVKEAFSLEGTTIMGQSVNPSRPSNQVGNSRESHQVNRASDSISIL